MITFTICEFLKDYKTYEAIILPMQNKERILLGLQKMNSEEAMDYFLDLLNEYKCHDTSRGDNTEDNAED